MNVNECGGTHATVIGTPTIVQTARNRGLDIVTKTHYSLSPDPLRPDIKPMIRICSMSYYQFSFLILRQDILLKCQSIYIHYYFFII